MASSTDPINQVPKPSPRAPRTRVAIQRLLCDSRGVWAWVTWQTFSGVSSVTNAVPRAVAYARQSLREVRVVRVRTGRIVWTAGEGMRR